MTVTDDTGGDPLAPNEAFEVLGNEIRMEILQTLAEAGDPVAFSELQDRIGVKDSGQFNYHLDKLMGHFVERTDDGYQLRQAGRRVVMAVLSGAVTESPVLETTVTDLRCTICDARMAVDYHDENMRYFCTECEGNFDRPREGGPDTPVERGFLGSLPLPPAAVSGRTAEEVAHTAMAWGQAYLLLLSSGVCPECGSTIDRSVAVCDRHEPDESICEHCHGYHPARIHLDCTHCIVEWDGRFDNGFIHHTAVQSFLLDHGLNFVAPRSNVWAGFDYEEDIRSTDPFEARLTYVIGDDSLTITVDDDLSVVDIERGSPPAAE